MVFPPTELIKATEMLAAELEQSHNPDITEGGKLLRIAHDPFEERSRPCKDLPWIVFAFASLLCICSCAVKYNYGIANAMHLHESQGHGAFLFLGIVIASSGCASMLTAVAFLEATYCLPSIFVPIVLTCVTLGRFCCLSPLQRARVIRFAELLSMLFKGDCSNILVALACAVLVCSWFFAAFVAILGILSCINRTNTFGGPLLLLFACVFAWIYGNNVINNVCHVVSCRVVGQWFYGKAGKPRANKTVLVACTTSFGSICCGTFLVPSIYILDLLGEAACLGNCASFILGNSAGFINRYAFVQCALRGCGFMDAARVTYALCIHHKCKTRDLTMCRIFANLGAIASCSVGSIVAFVASQHVSANLAIVHDWSDHDWSDIGTIGAISGALVGFCVGVVMNQPIKAGAVTLYVCSAEQPDRLKASHPELLPLFFEETEAASKGRSLEMRSWNHARGGLIAN